MTLELGPRQRLRTRFLLVAGVGVAVGLLASLTVAMFGFNRLSTESSKEIEQGLGDASREYLSTHVVDSASRTHSLLERATLDLEIAADILQDLEDRADELGPLHQALSHLPLFEDRLRYHPEGGWYQNADDEPMSVSVWGYLLQPSAGDGPPPLRPEVADALAETAIFDLVLPPFQREGASKLQIFYVGGEDAPFMRLTPWSDAAGEADKKYPGHNASPFWSFYFPGLMESWRARMGSGMARDTQVTLTPPYEDAGGAGVVMTLFHPIYTADRSDIAGALGLDLTINQIVDYIKDLKLFDSGFAFLAQSDGNVLAINTSGEQILRLRGSTAAGEGVEVLQRSLRDSSEASVAGLKLPVDDAVSYKEIDIGGESYALALQRLPAMNIWAGPDGIHEQHWTLGMVVPAREIYASLTRSQASIAAATQQVAAAQVLINMATLLAVVLGVSVVSRRMTAALDALSDAAKELTHKNYDVALEVHSEDEVGHLTRVFMGMAAEIREYTSNLEGLVRQRTRELSAANEEISALNERLKAENVRLGAELDVARRLQLMVLPSEQELSEIGELDIAGFMEPADEVGGDYYDVLPAGGGFKIGIGDVTGHGLESGVLMIMLQTAVRTLLIAGERDPKRFLDLINRTVYENIQRINMDRSATLAFLDYQGGELILTGQHEEAIVVRADGTLERVDTLDLGLPVGIDADIQDFVESARLRLEPGDVVVLYTDGITEAENPAGEQYGVERLCAAATRTHRQPAADIKRAIIEDVMAFVGEQRVFDDITLVVIRRED
ncbi:MAG: SpoIIE family protein phosphatase [Alphaproteobacteria bacterium]|nr:SpoIIE family protein phosphatase [Alphaproteobacteria bacterium]